MRRLLLDLFSVIMAIFVASVFSPIIVLLEMLDADNAESSYRIQKW